MPITSLRDLVNHMTFTRTLVWAVLKWADERNLINGATAQGQTLKLGSEVSETLKAVRERDQKEIIDGIGDCLVVCIIVSAQIGYPLIGALDATETVRFNRLYEEAAQCQGEDPVRWSEDAAMVVGIRIGYLQDAVLKGDYEKASDLMVGLVAGLYALADAVGYSLETCLQAAYDEIKDRKGIVYNGSFIKESDPRYATTLEIVKLERENNPCLA